MGERGGEESGQGWKARAVEGSLFLIIIAQWRPAPFSELVGSRMHPLEKTTVNSKGSIQSKAQMCGFAEGSRPTAALWGQHQRRGSQAMGRPGRLSRKAGKRQKPQVLPPGVLWIPSLLGNVGV